MARAHRYGAHPISKQMKSNKFFTLKQLEEIDQLGPTAYFYVNPGMRETVLPYPDVVIEEAEELTEEDIIHEEEKDSGERPCPSQVLPSDPGRLVLELSEEHCNDNSVLSGLFELSDPF